MVLIYSAYEKVENNWLEWLDVTNMVVFYLNQWNWIVRGESHIDFCMQWVIMVQIEVILG